MGVVDDEVFYEKVEEEVASGQMKPGLRTKAYSHAGGDEHASRSMYIPLRGEQLIQASAAAELATRQARRNARSTARRMAFARGVLFVFFVFPLSLIALVSFLSVIFFFTEGKPGSALFGLCIGLTCAWVSQAAWRA